MKRASVESGEEGEEREREREWREGVREGASEGGRGAGSQRTISMQCRVYYLYNITII